MICWTTTKVEIHDDGTVTLLVWVEPEVPKGEPTREPDLEYFGSAEALKDGEPTALAATGLLKLDRWLKP